MNQRTAEQWALFATHRDVARRVVSRAEFSPWKHRRDELTSAAEDGILRAFKSWSPGAGAAFRTWAFGYALWGARMCVREVFGREPLSSADSPVDEHAAPIQAPEAAPDVAADWPAIEQELAEVIHKRTHLRMVRASRNARLFIRVTFQGESLEDVASAWRIDVRAARRVVERTAVDFNLWKTKARGTAWAQGLRTEQSSRLAA